MGVKLIVSILIVVSILLAIGLLFAFNLSSDQTIPNEQGKPTIYVVEEQKAKTYIIGEGNSLDWVEETGNERLQLNVERYIIEDGDEQELFELKGKLSNVRRIVDHELVIGYDEDLDDLRWKEVE